MKTMLLSPARLACLVLSMAISLPLYAQQLDTYEDHFDQLKEQVINGQDGWKSSSDSIVQTQVNATSGGKALKLASVKSWVEKTCLQKNANAYWMLTNKSF